ncbi:peptidoglycan-binding domain-containing protein, partial [Micrococcus sp. F3Y]
RPGRLAIVGLLVLALLAASFVAGRFFQPPRTADPAAVSQPIDVWAAVEQRVVDTSASFAGTVAAGKTRSVAVTAEGPAVVLRQTVKPGQTVRPGDVAGEVSGVTYVFLPEPLALYRDLTEGDTGEDVSSLQRALEKVGHTAGKDGVLDARTARALRELFQEAGAPL